MRELLFGNPLTEVSLEAPLQSSISREISWPPGALAVQKSLKGCSQAHGLVSFHFTFSLCSLRTFNFWTFQRSLSTFSVLDRTNSTTSSKLTSKLKASSPQDELVNQADYLHRGPPTGDDPRSVRAPASEGSDHLLDGQQTLARDLRQLQAASTGHD